ncbi:unnamed protein product [Meganyctiphanes norvegica]|uniref:C2H2-type domain-containing protein n=1 Tax=Meganyctiphanes norvegica TaxID=48144 RepID=A0AAV2RHT1_MEGNR
MVSAGNFSCDICNLEFSSRPIVDAHLSGSKHQRKVEGKELLRKLHQTESCFTQDEETGKLTCLICFIELTSPQLLQAHLQGTKHQNKTSGETGSEKRPADNEGQAEVKKPKSDPKDDKHYCDTCQAGCNSDAQWEAHLKSRKHLNKLTLAAGGVVEPSPAKKRNPIAGTEKHFCDTCQAGCNSDAQWDVHVNSKKHLNKIAGQS